MRYPEIIVPAQHGGDCPVHVLKTEPDTDSCNEHPCPGIHYSVENVHRQFEAVKATTNI